MLDGLSCMVDSTCFLWIAVICKFTHPICSTHIFFTLQNVLPHVRSVTRNTTVGPWLLYQTSVPSGRACVGRACLASRALQGMQ
jgi:hypothetical protein